MNMKIFVILIIIVTGLFSAFPAMAQSIVDPEETSRVVEYAETIFVVCDPNPTGEFSDVKYYNELECDHNILFLKGICEDSNNTAHNWCYNADMERFLNDRGLKNAPRPPDAWCNMFVDECISRLEAMKESTIESSEVFGTSGSETTTNLLNSLDDSIQELEDKKDAAAQGDNENDNDD